MNGFQICDFEPDSDPCESCGEAQKQLYFRRTDHFSDDGEYYCLDCVSKEVEALKESEQ